MMERSSRLDQNGNQAKKPGRMQADLTKFFEDVKSTPDAARIRNRNTTSAEKNSKHRLHVGIIGAGITGLRCADILTQHNVKVTILEGRDRIGGRISQSDYLGYPVDMGPNWIHGTRDNPIVDIAKETHTTVSDTGEEGYFVDEMGVVMQEDKANSLSDYTWQIITEAIDYSKENSERIAPTESLKDFFDKKLAESDLNPDDRKTVLQMARTLGSFTGDTWEKQSLRNFWLEECLDGGNLYVASTHRSIVERIAEAALLHGQIQFSTKVISVEARDDVNGIPNVLIITESGKSLDFDEVVVTVPIGCLQRDIPRFSPPLPPRLTQAIKNTSYSRLEKVYITFPKAFWEPATTNIPSLDSALPNNHISPTASIPIINKPANLPEPFPIFGHFLAPCYSSQNYERHNIELVSLSSPSLGSYSHPSLLFYTYGSLGTQIISLISSLTPSSPEYFAALNEFFLPYYSRLPNYDRTSSDCHPKGILASDWQSDEMAGWGSYTNFSLKDEDDTGETGLLEEDVLELRHGLPERGIWLAGEHTAPLVALGTVTGAYWSGQWTAEKILRYHDLIQEDYLK
ncbi:hypothetical protein MMC11_009155 [Xylographa trunciseda]|nr:hypothetical protein [Xylographa trunciseda]